MGDPGQWRGDAIMKEGPSYPKPRVAVEKRNQHRNSPNAEVVVGLRINTLQLRFPPKTLQIESFNNHTSSRQLSWRSSRQWRERFRTSAVTLSRFLTALAVLTLPLHFLPVDRFLGTLYSCRALVVRLSRDRGNSLPHFSINVILIILSGRCCRKSAGALFRW